MEPIFRKPRSSGFVRFVFRKQSKKARLKITLTHAGKQHAYKVARAMKELDVLDQFMTSGYIKSKALQNLITKSGNTFWPRRFESGLSGKSVNPNWRFEIPESAQKFFFGKTQKLEQLVYQRDEAFDRWVSKKIMNKDSDVFWGFQGSCMHSLLSAKQSQKITVCELATAHVTEAKNILAEEATLHPEWADTITNLVFPFAYEKRLELEPFLADYAVVASKFSKDSLIQAGMEEEKIHTIPLGFDVDHITYSKKSFDDWNQRPMKILYSGTVTQRKGISYLLEAMYQFSNRDVELHIIGNADTSLPAFIKEKSLFHYHGSMAQSELFRAYGNYDLLVLPTLFEGFGLVIVEAMAAGLPVITTSHSIGPDLVEEEAESGTIIPIRSSSEIVNAIEHYKNLSRENMIRASLAARRASLKFTWDRHSENLNTFANTTLKK
jgi:glycosyltransferase involved in cell wall biosynthesis